MTSKKTSLIICAYNEEKYISDCLSHAAKSAGDGFLEILVIDNASSDKTREMAEKFPNVRVIREDAKGLTKARQRGFLEAKGEILAYIDADTHMPERWLERLESEFAANEKISVVSGPYVYFDIPKWQQFLVKMYWYLLGMPVYWLVGYMAVGGNFAVKKSVVEKMGGFDTTIEFYGEDTDLARRASRFGKVKFIPSFVMYTSGRRLAKQGIVSTAFEYIKNYAAEAFLHRPATAKYTDYR